MNLEIKAIIEDHGSWKEVKGNTREISKINREEILFGKKYTFFEQDKQNEGQLFNTETISVPNKF